jgi:hypothetical protein
VLLLIVGCAAEQSAPRNEVDVMVAAPPLPLVTASSVSPSPSAVEAADPCATAFEDQLTLSVDIEIRERGVHPGWKELFLDHCQSMPPAFQRCASPLYQTVHEAECEAVKEESGTPAARQWSATFKVLQDAPESLTNPPAQKR